MDVESESLLPSLYKREEFPLFGKEGEGEIFTTTCLFYSGLLSNYSFETPILSHYQKVGGLSPKKIPSKNKKPKPYSTPNFMIAHNTTGMMKVKGREALFRNRTANIQIGIASRKPMSMATTKKPAHHAKAIMSGGIR
jgi:hypothetical protein